MRLSPGPMASATGVREARTRSKQKQHVLIYRPEQSNNRPESFRCLADLCQVGGSWIGHDGVREDVDERRDAGRQRAIQRPAQLTRLAHELAVPSQRSDYL